MHKILILGPQGSGKGTQAKILSQELGIPAFSMGDLCRAEIAEKTEIGQEIEHILAAGELISDEIALALMKKRVEQEDTKKGYIIDGYPRNDLQRALYEKYDRPTQVLVIVIPREETLKRIASRALKEGRVDDTEEGIKKRLEVYERETLPIIEGYGAQGLVSFVNGMGTIEEVAERVKSAVREPVVEVM